MSGHGSDGFSATVNRRSPTFATDLRAACPDGANVLLGTRRRQVQPPMRFRHVKHGMPKMLVSTRSVMYQPSSDHANALWFRE